LNVILQKIDEIICNLLTQINYLNNQVTNITNQIITINGDIINIYNTLGECCGATTTTTSTTTAAPCESFSLDNTGTEAVAIIITDCITGDQEAIVLLPGETNICVETDSPLTVPGTVIVTPNGPCGPTTTTTTTAVPTTTTTTTASPCECLTFFNSDTSAHVVNYKDCNNINVGPIFIDSNETLQVCGGSGSASDPLVTISIGANCIDGACPVSTTTTTTTVYECTCYYAAVTISQEVLDVTDNGQIILNFNDCDGNPQENIYDTPGFYLLGCANFFPGIDSTALIDGIIVGLYVPITVYEQCCPESPTTSTTTTAVPPTTTTTTTIPCTCINIIISQADIDDATGNPTLNGNVNIAGSNGKQITCENEDIVIHYDTAGTYPYCLKTGAISDLSLFYLKDGEPVTVIQSEIVNLQSACTVDGECGPTTTTTTTLVPTTTTTTTSDITCDCLTFENTDTISHNLGYTDCSNFPVTGINIDPSEIISFCGDNPVVSNPSVTITFGGACILEVCPTTTTTTTECTRPSGLITVSYFNTFTVNDLVVDYTSSLFDACSACNFIKDNPLDIQEETSLFGQSGSFAVGQYVYAGLVTDCLPLANGFYITDHETCQITEILDGYIVNIFNCELTPTTTTTSSTSSSTTTSTTTVEPTTTTTTTVEPTTTTTSSSSTTTTTTTVEPTTTTTTTVAPAIGCIEVTNTISSGGTSECDGITYPITLGNVTVELLDNLGNPVIATEDITITLAFETRQCFDPGPIPINVPVTIVTGTSSIGYGYTEQIVNDCGVNDCQTLTDFFQSVVSISPSSYSLCPGITTTTTTTIAPTTTTTTTGTGTFLVENNSSSVTVDDASAVAWYTALLTPIGPGTNSNLADHGNTLNPITVVVTGVAIGEHCMTLYINGDWIDSIQFNIDGSYVFTAFTINTNDDVLIVISDGSCSTEPTTTTTTTGIVTCAQYQINPIIGEQHIVEYIPCGGSTTLTIILEETDSPVQICAQSPLVSDSSSANTTEGGSCTGVCTSYSYDSGGGGDIVTTDCFTGVVSSSSYGPGETGNFCATSAFSTGGVLINILGPCAF
jgi:hypothetical protein